MKDKISGNDFLDLKFTIMEDKNNVTNGATMSFQNPEPLFSVSTHGYILFKNRAAEELKLIQYQGKSYKCEEFWADFSKKGDYIFDHLTLELSSNGKNYSFVCRYSPVQNYFNVYGRDITLQKEKENELLRLSLVASANENGVVFNDNRGKILWVNEGFCKLTGFSANEILGKTPLDFCKGPFTSPETLKKVRESIGIDETFNIELIHYRKDGSWFWGRVRGQSFKSSDENIQYFAIVEDISREKNKEEQLKVLSQIAESNINAVIITDKEGLITWVNKSFTQMTGYSQSEAIGKKPGHLLQGPDTNQETIAYLKKQITAGQSFNTDIYNYSKAGKPYWLRIQGQPIKDANGELTGFFAVEENITQEKEIQERIKKSEDRFRLALEKIGDNVWEHDFKTGKTIFSKANNELWGYDFNDFIDEGALWWDSVFAEDLHLLKKNHLQYKNGEIDSHNLEYRIILKDGTAKWVLDRGVVLEKDQNNTPLRIIGTHTDITPIKQTEIALEQHVKQFKSLSENIPGVIYEYEFRTDGTEGFRYVSPAIERIFGIKPDEFNNNYLNYIYTDDRDRIKRKNEHCRSTLEPFYDESLLIIPGSAPKWHSVHSSFSYISQNGSKVFTGYMNDITERKTIEHTLVANEEKYHSIITNMELGLLEVDNDGAIIYANKSFCTMSGYTISELLGNSAAELFLTGDNSHIEKEKRKIRKEGIADAYEIETKDKNGNKKWWLVSGAPRYNDKAELVGSIGIHLDITNQKTQEVELIEARIKAEHLARTKDTFLANMSHEIRTPMNAIMGMSNQLAKTTLLPQQQFYIDTILSASDNLLVIINDILDLSKIEAGKLSFENIGFEITTVIKNALKVVTHKAEEKGLNLNQYFLDSNISPVLIGDPFRISQVLLNLLTNAIKFTDKGSVDLSCKLLKDNTTSQVIQINVKDTGSGMEESFVKVLFDKFSQEFESVTRQYGGTGLGMSICKELVELMGGEISVESKKGKGTTISFTLELQKGSNTDLPEKYVNHFGNDFLSGRKILITDDNELNRLVGSIILTNYGAEVLMAENGEKAIEMINCENPDMVLMDLQMPVMNGLEATKNLRQNGNPLPIIALTAAAIKGERENCIASGMNDYITKPFKEDEFLKTIEKWLREKPISSKAINPVLPTLPLYDLSKLRDISRGNETFVKKMVDMFCDQTPQMITEMIAAYQQGNLEQLGAIAHKLKPSIDNLNITSLKQLIRDIENISRDEPGNSSLSDLLNNVENIIINVVKTMKQEFPG